jgi:hypothetical protein
MQETINRYGSIIGEKFDQDITEIGVYKDRRIFFAVGL